MSFESSWHLIALAVIGNFVLGALWYAPFLFGSAWAKANGFKLAKMKGGWKRYVASLLSSIILASVLFGISERFDLAHHWEAIRVGFCLWLGLIVTSQAGGVIWRKYPFKAYLINIGYHLVSVAGILWFYSFWL